ncbi:MAG: potassium transporter TrkA [Epsilonproteobacteria bacterium]|nr:potassium transporter TrkA [Campylobacterota bacterium]NPA89623.1 potassium transporter TrkA [Campylobacterota bacterium]
MVSRSSIWAKLLVSFALWLDRNRTYRKIKHFFRELLTNDRYPPKKVFDTFMVFVVLFSVGILIYDIDYKLPSFFEWLDIYIITPIFIIEYLLRLWVYSDIREIILDEAELSALLGRPYRLGYVLWEIVKNKFKYITSPMAIIDLLAILPSYRPLRILRIFLLFRLFKILRYSKSINTFIEVLGNKKFELFILLISVGFVTFIGGALIYVLEAGKNPNIHSFFDAFYWSFITISTVGYGDITPTTEEGRSLTIILVVVGIGFISFATSIIVSAFSEKLDELKEERRLYSAKGMKKYSLICGFSDEAERLAEKLKEEKMSFIIVEMDKERVEKAISMGFHALTADATDTDFLKELNFDEVQQVFVLTNSDITNSFIILSIRNFNRRVPILSLASSEESVEKLKHAGATHVITPSRGTAILTAQYVNNPHIFDVLEAVLSESRGVILGEILIAKGSFLDGELIGEIDFNNYKLILIGLWKQHPPKKSPIPPLQIQGGYFYFNPPAYFRMEGGDLLVVMGYRVSIDYFKVNIEQSVI